MAPDMAVVEFPAARMVSRPETQSGQMPCIMTVNARSGVIPGREEIFLLSQATIQVSGDQRDMGKCMVGPGRGKAQLDGFLAMPPGLVVVLSLIHI